MYGHYLKLAISFAGLMFVTGFICLAVLSVTKVLPARKGLSFEEATCRVAHSEISCESGKCVCNGRGCLKDEDIPCLKVYVLCGSGDDKVVNRSVYSDKQEGNLLRKDIKHLKDECAFEIDTKIFNPELTSSQDLETYRLQRARPGTVITCYRNPKAPDVVVLENHGKEHYRRVVLHCVLWPVALIGLSILILASAMYFCPTRREYRRIP